MIDTPRRQTMQAVQGRAIAALLNPRPAVLVTCCDLEGRPNVLSVAWHTPLAHDPPQVGISIDVRRHSHRMIEQVGEFAINVVDDVFCEAVERCGERSGREVDKFLLAGLTTRPAMSIRPPVITGALAWLECAVTQSLSIGDHTFFVGRVRHAAAGADIFTDAWLPGLARVLLCLQRDRFGICAGERHRNRRGDE